MDTEGKIKTIHKYFVHFRDRSCYTPPPPLSKEAQRAKNHDTENDVNAVATICTKILSSLFPDLHFSNVGSVILDHFKTGHSHNSEHQCITTRYLTILLILFSPDGILTNSLCKSYSWKSNKDFQL